MIFVLFISVTKCNRAETALSLLRENKNGFDIVISDVHMPDMDGFKLLEHIGLFQLCFSILHYVFAFMCLK